MYIIAGIVVLLAFIFNFVLFVKAIADRKAPFLSNLYFLLQMSIDFMAVLFLFKNS